MRVISEQEFFTQFAQALTIELAARAAKPDCPAMPRMVTGPGRSGALAAVYASHMLGIPFLPFGLPCPVQMRPLLIVDTASSTGATMRRDLRQYRATYNQDNPIGVVAFIEPPRVAFWYEYFGPILKEHPDAQVIH